MTFLKNFLTDESGAVSVDWVVLCAAVVALAVTIAATIETEIDGIAGQIGGDMATELGANYTDG